MTFGTLDIVDEKGEQVFLIKAQFEIELMIKRLIPSHDNYPLRVRVHPENTKILRMVVNAFELTILNQKWYKALEDIKHVEVLAKSVSKLKHVDPDPIHFVGKLLPFQKEALDFLIKTKGNTLITDEMGLGKTVESLSFLSTIPKKRPVLVIAPLVTLINWKREIQRFLMLNDASTGKQQLLNPGSSRVPHVELIRSGMKQGKKTAIGFADFYVINYELVSKRFEDIRDLEPKAVIMDEIHSLRNDYTEKYKACKAICNLDSVEHRIGLSGTPIYNKGIEMFNICEIIKPGVLGERQEFVRRYCNTGWYDSTETSEESKPDLTRRLNESIMIRRKKIDVLKDLPDKIRMKQTISIDTSLYESEIQKLYDKISNAQDELSGMRSDEDMKEGLFELNKRIREMRVAERQIAGLAKVPYVIEYMKDLMDEYEEEKFVVFCHHLTVHKTLFDNLWKYNPVQVIGGQSDKDRQDAIDKFQTDKNCRVAICGLRAGSLGISLTSSAYVIFAELDWSPSIHRQAEDRLHRIGQKQKVFAHYLEGSGTFDEILSDKLLEKTMTISNVLGDKMESLDNKKAVAFLEKKFNFAKTKSNMAKLISEEK